MLWYLLTTCLAQSANLAPWFPPHLQRNIYQTLIHYESDGGQEKSTKIPDSVLRAALLRRAVEDIHRIIQIRTAKQACSSLLQKGSVGDDLWQRFLRAEKEMEEELRDVVMEANALGPNWGQIIFQSANEIANNTILRKRLDEIQSQADAEKDWWEKRRASIEKMLLEEESKESAKRLNKTGSDEDAVLVDPNTPAPTTTPSSSKKKKGGKK